MSNSELTELVVLLSRRFVSTSVTSVHQMENGFNIWSFNGKLLYRLPRERFFQVTLRTFLELDGFMFSYGDCMSSVGIFSSLYLDIWFFTKRALRYCFLAVLVASETTFTTQP